MKSGVVLVGRRGAALRAARGLGLRALVVTDGPAADAPEHRHWSRPFRDPAALAELAPVLRAAATIRGVLATTESAVVPAARLRAALGLPGTAVAAAVRCTDKFAMKRAVRGADVACAEHVTAAEGLDREGLVARLGLPLVVKARASSGGRGTRIHRDAAGVPPRLEEGWLAEAFVTGTEMSIESVVLDGELLFVNPTEYLRPAWANVVPAALTAETWAAVQDVNRRVLRALGVDRGLTHVEVFVDGDRVTFGEIAARAPGGHLMELIERVYGFDPWEALLRVAVGERPPTPGVATCAAGVWLFHPGAGRVTRVAGVEEARALPGVVDLVVRVAVGDDVGPRIGVGQEVGHVTVVGKDRDEAVLRLTDAHDAVTIVVNS